MTLRLAVWSGPRNISTAMMRAWQNRPDCAVSDEPLYAAYLAQTGLDHPGRHDILAHGERDWRKVVKYLQGPAPEAKPIWYQKHMTHHLLPGMDLDWIQGLTNVLLIRAPDQVVESYLKSRAELAPEDIGLLQQATLFETLSAQQDQPPWIIDADDFLQQPEAYLQALCQHLGIAFLPAMLSWPPGRRASDGIWAPHWYEAVWRSTGFEPWRARRPQLSGPALAVAKACGPAYERLYQARLRLS